MTVIAFMHLMSMNAISLYISYIVFCKESVVFCVLKQHKSVLSANSTSQ